MTEKKEVNPETNELIENYEKKEVSPETGELIDNYEKMFEINTAEYDGREEIVIDFKDGQRLLLKDVGRLMDESKTASQPVLGKEYS